MKQLTIIAALDERGGIGKDGTLPWQLPVDLQHFKNTTAYGVVIMGRKTCESIGRALPNRRNIVITRQKDWTMAGVETAGSLDEATEMVNDHSAFIIGGGELYKEALPHCNHMVLTQVRGDFQCDTFFPKFNLGEWNVWEKEEQTCETSGTQFAFATYMRKPGKVV